MPIDKNTIRTQPASQRSAAQWLIGPEHGPSVTLQRSTVRFHVSQDGCFFRADEDEKRFDVGDWSVTNSEKSAEGSDTLPLPTVRLVLRRAMAAAKLLSSRVRRLLCPAKWG